MEVIRNTSNIDFESHANTVQQLANETRGSIRTIFIAKTKIIQIDGRDYQFSSSYGKVRMHALPLPSEKWSAFRSIPNLEEINMTARIYAREIRNHREVLERKRLETECKEWSAGAGGTVIEFPSSITKGNLIFYVPETSEVFSISKDDGKRKAFGWGHKKVFFRDPATSHLIGQIVASKAHVIEGERPFAERCGLRFDRLNAGERDCLRKLKSFSVGARSLWIERSFIEKKSDARYESKMKNDARYDIIISEDAGRSLKNAFGLPLSLFKEVVEDTQSLHSLGIAGCDCRESKICVKKNLISVKKTTNKANNTSNIGSYEDMEDMVSLHIIGADHLTPVGENWVDEWKLPQQVTTHISKALREATLTQLRIILDELTPEAERLKAKVVLGDLLKLSDDYALLITMMKCTAKNEDEFHYFDGYDGRKHNGPFDVPKYKLAMYVREWIDQNVKPHYKADMEDLLRNPMEFLERFDAPELYAGGSPSKRPTLCEMINFEGAPQVAAGQVRVQRTSGRRGGH